MSDALTDVLDSIRMEGSIFSRAALTAPWGVESGQTVHGVFHAVLRGNACARLHGDDETVALEPGDVVLMPFGDNHLMTDAPSRLTRPIAEMTAIDRRGMGQLVVDGGGDETSLICGSISFDQAGAHPVFSVLPRMVTVRDVTGETATIVETLISLIATEVDEPVPGSETVVARLTDVLVVYVLRNYINSLDDGEGGWLGGLRDPAVAEALGLIHRQPERGWSVDELADEVGLSRSAFHDRFRRTVGETPADYSRRWRVHVATRLLREDRRSVAATARMLGYRTEAAFSNAFTRVMGVRPGAFKNAA